MARLTPEATRVHCLQGGASERDTQTAAGGRRHCRRPRDGAARAEPRVDDGQRRRAAQFVDADGSPVDEGRRREGRAQVPLEDQAERREPSAQFADAADPARSADFAPRLQSAGVRRHEQRADLRHRYGSQPDLLGARDQLFVDRAARQQLVGVPGRADVGVHAADGRRAAGVRRRPRRWPLGELGRRAGPRRAEPAAGARPRPRQRSDASRGRPREHAGRPCGAARPRRAVTRQWRRAHGEHLRAGQRWPRPRPEHAQRHRAFPRAAVPAGECQGGGIDPGRRRALHRDVERLRIGGERRLRARRQRRQLPSPFPGRPVDRALPAAPARRWAPTAPSTSPRPKPRLAPPQQAMRRARCTRARLWRSSRRP